MAEAYHAGLPFGFLPRARFRESPILADFVQRELPSVELSPEAFLAGDWLPAAHVLLEMPRVRRQGPNGADQAAQFIIDLLG